MIRVFLVIDVRVNTPQPATFDARRMSWAFGAGLPGLLGRLLLWAVDVRGVSKEYFRRFHQRLRHRGMRMDAEFQVRGERGHFDGQHTFGDVLAGARADHADAQDALCLRIDDELRHAVRTIDGNRAADRGPRELGDLDLPALLLRFRLGQAAPGNLRIGEDDSRDGLRL